MPPKPKSPPDAPVRASEGFLKGVKVFVPSKGNAIPALLKKIEIWTARVAENGGSLTQDPTEPGITHALVGETGIACLPMQLQPSRGPPGDRGRITQQQGQAAAGAELAPQPQQAQAPPPQQLQAPISEPLSAGAADPSPSKVAALGAVTVPPTASPGAAAAAGRTKKRKRPQPFQGCIAHYHWLERCLLARRMLPVEEFPAPGTKAGSGAASPAAAQEPPAGTASKGSIGGPRSNHISSNSELSFMQHWLGEAWHPGCEEMKEVELALQAVYNAERCMQLGNEPLAQALRELSKYEQALEGNQVKSDQGGKVVNRRLLQYARAAAAVRGCSYKLQPPVVERQLPFVGEAIAGIINDILTTGTCAVLEAFRADMEVCDSKGVLRQGTAGAKTRALFQKLPGIGAATARRLWELGLRSFEDMEWAAEPGGPLAEGGAAPLNAGQLFSLRHREELLEGTSAAEVEEMHQVVKAALVAVSGPGWMVEVVGGASRSHANKDSDLLCTHPTIPVDGVIRDLREHLIRQGQLISGNDALLNTQAGRMPTHLQRSKEDYLWELGRSSKGPKGDPNLDRYDHIYGIMRTAGGRVRRVDIIITPPEEFAFALVGWIGSRQFNRFMRQHAKENLGMHLNSHSLMREVDGEVYIVPSEKPPLNGKGQEWWPPGWGPGRRVQTQRGVFELLGIPYREPWQRDCF